MQILYQLHFQFTRWRPSRTPFSSDTMWQPLKLYQPLQYKFRTFISRGKINTNIVSAAFAFVCLYMRSSVYREWKRATWQMHLLAFAAPGVVLWRHTTQSTNQTICQSVFRQLNSRVAILSRSRLCLYYIKLVCRNCCVMNLCDFA